MTAASADTMLYRSMKARASLVPECGPTARSLGVRVPRDVEPDENERVRPGAGGMSVSPDDPMYLPPHRRPFALGGFGKDPVFSIVETRLGSALRFRRDPRDSDHHGFVEPTAAVSVEAYQLALCATAGAWGPL